MFAIIAHEVMHGVVALRLGDDTALRAGRLTLNPISHIDLFGTIILPFGLYLFGLPVLGYAKPVPVDFRVLRGGRSGMLKVAAAGPLTNFVLALVSGLLLRAAPIFLQGSFGSTVAMPIARMLQASVIVNVELGVFNLFPVLPLDGGRVLFSVLPVRVARAYAQTERYGFLILMLLLYTHWLDVAIIPVMNMAFKPDAHLTLEGHADPRGSVEYNDALTERRVARSKSFLVEQGIPAGSIETRSLGKQHLLTSAQVKEQMENNPDVTPEERQRFMSADWNGIVLAQNRRVDVILSATGQKSVRRYPFNAKDAATLLDDKQLVH